MRRRSADRDASAALHQVERHQTDSAARRVYQHAIAFAHAAPSLRPSSTPSARRPGSPRRSSPSSPEDAGSRPRASRRRARSSRRTASPRRPSRPSERAVDARTERVDPSRDLVADDGGERRRVVIHPHARHQIGEVHAARLHFDPNLTVARARDLRARAPRAPTDRRCAESRPASCPRLHLRLRLLLRALARLIIHTSLLVDPLLRRRPGADRARLRS